MSLAIAFAVHDARPGGGQDRYALELVNRLAARHDVTLLARSAEGLASAVRFERVAAPRRPAPIRARAFALRVRARLRRRRWDVVHAIGGALPGAGVITAQYCHAAARRAARTWPSALVGPAERAYRAAQMRFAEADERRALHHPDLRAVIGVSRRTMDEWETYGRLPAVTAVIPNAAGTEETRGAAGAAEPDAVRRALGVPEGARVLLLVGALVRKGIETAIAVLPRLDETVHLVAVGAGPHRRIEHLARRAGVGQRLHLVAPVRDIERYYRAADVFVFPTRYEPFGMVIAEAWAAGIPVVTTATAGALEYAQPGEDALAVDDPTDADGFAARVRRVLHDRAVAERLRSNGRRVAAELTWERVVAETETVYHRVTKGGKGEWGMGNGAT